MGGWLGGVRVRLKTISAQLKLELGLSLATIIARAIILLQIITVSRTISLKLRLAFKILMAYVDRKKSNNCS